MIATTTFLNQPRTGPGHFEGAVLLVGNFLSSHGMGTRQVCEELAERLSASGVKTIATSSRPGRAGRMIDMVATAWLRRGDYRVAQVDVFSGASFVWAEAVCFALRAAGKPYILTLHGGGLPEFLARHPRRGRALLASATCVTVPSRYLLERLRPYHDKLIPLPNAIELARYRYRQRTTPEPRLVWLRAFHKIYNPELAPRVVALLADEFPGLTLTMTGPDKDGSLETTRAEARRLGVENRIRFQGPVAKEAVPEAMAAGDIYLSTTTVDNMPVTVLEAMACGLCVISTNVSGVPFLIDDGANGLLVPPDDAEAMARAVRRVLGEPGVAGRISSGGRGTAEQYDWNAVLPRWRDLLAGAALANGGADR